MSLFQAREACSIKEHKEEAQEDKKE